MMRWRAATAAFRSCRQLAAVHGSAPTGLRAALEPVSFAAKSERTVTISFPSDRVTMLADTADTSISAWILA